jgi:hypothetical protein
LRRIEKLGFPRARAAATDVDRSNDWFIKQDNGRAGAELNILGIADLESGDVGYQIAQSAASQITLSGSDFGG